MSENTEFYVDMWDLDLTDEEIDAILTDLESQNDFVAAGTWEDVEFPSPW